MLLSRHRDAEILSYVAYHMGFEFVRGSTNRGGRGGLAATAGQEPAHAPDDHARRPARPAAATGPGTDLPGLEAGHSAGGDGLGYDRPWRASSWDRFAVPRPFSRARCILSPELHVPPDLDRDGLEHFRLKTERLLNRLCDEAEAWAEAGSRKPGQFTPQPAVRRRAAATGRGVAGMSFWGAVV